MKVVINTEMFLRGSDVFGGEVFKKLMDYGLPWKKYKRMDDPNREAELSLKDYKGKPYRVMDNIYGRLWVMKERNNPILVKAIEELHDSCWKVIEIPDDVAFQIMDDGQSEYVQEKTREWHFEEVKE